MKRLLALLLAVVMAVSCLVACGPTNDDGNNVVSGDNQGNENVPGEENVVPTVFDDPNSYVYKDGVQTMATNWNPHTYQNTDDAYPADFLRTGLYSFIFNDELNPVEGKDPYEGYTIVPEMAASMPVDVTEQVKKDRPEFGIPESADSGFAYTIDLNPDCTWEDGTPINADTYVYSMKRLLDPALMNYRATDMYAQSLAYAGARAYANAGKTEYADSLAAYAMADLVKGADGQYETADGIKMYIALDVALDWCSGNTLKDYVDAYGADYFDVTNWETLVGMMDENGVIPLTDENLALFTPVTCGNPAWGETEAELPNYFATGKYWPECDYDSTVGCYKTGEYQITIVLEKALKGFNLLYNLGGNWIVHEELYESCLKETNGTYTTTYNTSVETTLSYGPYKLTNYQADKNMHFVRNENWWGYKDGKHVYVDPTDGKTYPMYQTTEIDTQVVAEAATRKLMFLKGELMGYGLQREDFDAYRSSDYCYATPGTTVFFLIFNGYKEKLNEREAAADFDTATKDLQSMTIQDFRKAIAVSYDRDLFAATISPSRSGGFGLIGTGYIYDPDNASEYRDTDQAKQALCDFYSVDVSEYDSLDAAVDSITGFDPVKAKELFTSAYNQALEAGYVTDADGDGKCDQVVTIEYSISADDDFQTKTVDYINEKLNEATKDTPYDGKIKVVKSAPYGNEWADKFRDGFADMAFAGWSGSKLDPFSLTDLYVNPSYAYDANWFNASTVDVTVEIDGEDITMTLKQWSDALNGTTVNVDGKDYNFGEGMTDIENRLAIFAAFEVAVLNTYDYIPMLQDASMALLSQQVYYVVEDYNPILDRGGMTYMRYNYNEDEWKAYVAENNGELKY